MTSSPEPRIWDDPGTELITAITDTMRQIRILNGELLDLIARADEEHLAQHAGYRSTTALLAEVLHMTPAKAARLVRQAEQVSESLTPTGHTTPAALPSVREALHAGLIDGEHIDAVAEVLKELPTWASLADRETVEAALAATAQAHNPYAVRKHGEVLVQAIDQDGSKPHEEAQLAEPSNSFTYRRTRDGHMTFRGDLEQEVAEVFENLLGVLGAPKPLGKDIPDPRPTKQRLGDAVSDIIDRAAASPKLPTRSGARPRLTVFLDLNTLTDAVGAATLEGGSALCPSATRRLACDAEIIPMVLNSDSVPPRRRTHPPARQTRPTHRVDRPRQRLRLPGVHDARPLDRGPPHRSLDRRWAHRHGQPYVALVDMNPLSRGRDRAVTRLGKRPDQEIGVPLLDRRLTACRHALLAKLVSSVGSAMPSRVVG